MNALDKRLFDEVLCDTPNRENISALLKQGADINAVDEKGRSLLYCLLEQINRNKMLANGIEARLWDEQGALRITHENLRLLRKNADSIGAALIQWLLEAGADPNAECIGGGVYITRNGEWQDDYICCLKEAVWTLRPDIVEMLLRFSADPNPTTGEAGALFGWLRNEKAEYETEGNAVAVEALDKMAELFNKYGAKDGS